MNLSYIILIMNEKKLIDKLAEVIDKHIEEVFERKMETILDELLSKKSKVKFKDVFDNECFLDEITKDHVMPKNADGSTGKTNIMYMCKTSNQQKSNKLEGEINGIEFKIDEDKNHKLKSGKVGLLSIKKPSDKNMKSISTKKENKKYDDFKKSKI